MKLPFFHVDAFADRVFAGNPAAVVLLDAWLPDAVLQAMAAEHALSETAFVIVGEGRHQLRWFAPAKEVDLCGHATLSAGWVLFKERFPESRHLVFDTRSGELTVTRAGGPRFDPAEPLRLDFPARPPLALDAGDPRAAQLADALGARPLEILEARDLMAVFGTAADVRALRPDFARLAALETHAVIATAPGDAASADCGSYGAPGQDASSGRPADFVSRFFAPRAGVPEDPVTGSAHCTLIPYWAARLDKPRLLAHQISARGGALHCEMRGDRVGIAGQVVPYLRGEVTVDG